MSRCVTVAPGGAYLRRRPNVLAASRGGSGSFYEPVVGSRKLTMTYFFERSDHGAWTGTATGNVVEVYFRP